MIMEKISLSKPVCTTRELASVLSPAGRSKMAFRYFPNSVEKSKLPDGRTYIEALSGSLRNGNSALQTKALLRLVQLYRQNLNKWQVRRVGNKRILEDVLRFLESRGLTPDAQTVSIVRDRLRKRQSPKD